MFQLMVTIGVLVSYLSDLYFADESDMTCWRPMFYVGVIPACILLIGMFFMPETPRWLMSQGRHDESYPHSEQDRRGKSRQRFLFADAGGDKKK